MQSAFSGSATVCLHSPCVKFVLVAGRFRHVESLAATGGCIANCKNRSSVSITCPLTTNHPLQYESEITVVRNLVRNLAIFTHFSPLIKDGCGDDTQVKRVRFRSLVTRRFALRYSLYNITWYDVLLSTHLNTEAYRVALTLDVFIIIDGSGNSFCRWCSTEMKKLAIPRMPLKLLLFSRNPTTKRGLLGVRTNFQSEVNRPRTEFQQVHLLNIFCLEAKAQLWHVPTVRLFDGVQALNEAVNTRISFQWDCSVTDERDIQDRLIWFAYIMYVFMNDSFYPRKPLCPNRVTTIQPELNRIQNRSVNIVKPGRWKFGVKTDQCLYCHIS